MTRGIIQTADAAAPALPRDTRNKLFDAYLRTSDPVPEIAERLGITLRQFIDWHDHPETRELIRDLDRIALERAAHRKAQSAPAAAEALEFVSTRSHTHPEAARKAATAILRTPPSTHGQLDKQLPALLEVRELVPTRAPRAQQQRITATHRGLRDPHRLL